MAEQLHHAETAPPIMEPEQLLPTAEQATPLQAGETLTKTNEQLAVEARHNLAKQAVEVNDPVKHFEAQQAAEEAAQNAPPPVHSSQLRAVTLGQELRGIRRQLAPTQRVLSRVIHQPVVRVVSEATGKTVSRPSGLLGGGLVAFVGTTTYLYLAKHLGFPYNYGVFLVLFAGGFVFGLLLELAVHLSLRSRRQVD